MTWIWATLLLILSAPFVLWPLLRAAPPAVADEDPEEDGAGAPDPSAPDG